MVNKNDSLMEENIKSQIEVSIPAWGETIDTDGGLVVSDTKDDLELLKVDTSQKVSATVQTTADTLKFLSELTEDDVDMDLDFLYDDLSENILEDIFAETSKQQRNIDAITGDSKSKTTGMTIDLIDELKKAAPKSFEKNQMIHGTGEVLVDIKNEGDLVNLMVIMTRHKNGVDGTTPKYIEEERRRLEILEQQRLREEQERLRREAEQRKRDEQKRLAEERRLAELERQKEIDRLAELERQREIDRLAALENAKQEEQPPKKTQRKKPIIESLENSGGQLIGEQLANNTAYEDELESYQIDLGDFGEDESSTYSLEQLKKKTIVSEDTIL